MPPVRLARFLRAGGSTDPPACSTVGIRTPRPGARPSLFVAIDTRYAMGERYAVEGRSNRTRSRCAGPGRFIESSMPGSRLLEVAMKRFVTTLAAVIGTACLGAPAYAIVTRSVEAQSATRAVCRDTVAGLATTVAVADLPRSKGTSMPASRAAATVAVAALRTAAEAGMPAQGRRTLHRWTVRTTGALDSRRHRPAPGREPFPTWAAVKP